MEIEDPFGRKQTSPNGDMPAESNSEKQVAEHYVNLDKVVKQIDEDSARLLQTRIRRPAGYIAATHTLHAAQSRNRCSWCTQWTLTLMILLVVV